MDFDPATRSAKDNYQFMCAAVAPRPIAWVTTQNASGLVNVAPFSWFNAVCADPPMLMLAIANHKDGAPKDTIANVRASGEMVVHVVVRPDAETMVATSAAYLPHESEAEALGLDLVGSTRVKVPGLAGPPIRMECVVDSIQTLGHAPHVNLVLARVVHLHADDAVLVDGVPDNRRFNLVARLGGHDYADSSTLFTMPRPRRP